MIAPAYRYRATCRRVIDGDTYELDVDLGFRVSVRIMVRLRGPIDCPEVHTPEGMRARDDAIALLNGAALVIESYKDQQSFARWVCNVYVGGVSVADELRRLGSLNGWRR